MVLGVTNEGNYTYSIYNNCYVIYTLTDMYIVKDNSDAASIKDFTDIPINW